MATDSEAPLSLVEKLLLAMSLEEVYDGGREWASANAFGSELDQRRQMEEGGRRGRVARRSVAKSHWITTREPEGRVRRCSGAGWRREGD